MSATASHPLQPTSRDPLARLAEQGTWITPHAEVALQRSVWTAYQDLLGPKLRGVLHGDWLHEPLHVILVEVPVGSWTATLLFDALAIISPSKKLDFAADATLLVGLAGAVGSAITGMNDWSEIQPRAARRIGLVHGMLNITATGLYVASAIARSRKSRTIGRALGTLGYLLVSASAHLGGNLIYEHGIGVAPHPGAPDTVTRNMRG